MCPAHESGETEIIREDFIPSIGDSLGAITQMIGWLDVIVMDELVDGGPSRRILMGGKDSARSKELSCWSRGT